MRIKKKKQLKEILDSMQQLHGVLADVHEINQRNMFLEDCQYAAEAIYQGFASDVKTQEKVKKYLEEYVVYNKNLINNKDINNIEIREMNLFSHKIYDLLEKQRISYHVVFYPYKASMWDSFETVWEEAVKDMDCIVHVVPIPYYEYNRMEGKIEEKYEIDLFPENVNVTHYKEYKLDENLPEVGYIHNPYDDANLITQVDSSFFSNRLKQYIDNLIYIPYFVKSNVFSEQHLNLPVYNNVDYIIVQSNKIKQQFYGNKYYNKVKVFGSPKFDSVIKMNQTKVSLPDDWKSKLEGKKIVMINSSISTILFFNEAYFDKMFLVFKTIKENGEVGVIWRPHPLFQLTIKSMRPYLFEKYKSLVDFFVESDIGIIDTTPNITKSVAISDAYIGEDSSSIVNLFSVVDKPIFLLNYLMKYESKFKKNIPLRILDIVNDVEGNKWFISEKITGIFYMDKKNVDITYLGDAIYKYKYQPVYRNMVKVKKNIYMSSVKQSIKMMYSIDNHTYHNLDFSEKNIESCQVFNYQNKIYYLPITNEWILEYDIAENKMKKFSQCIIEICKNFEIGNDNISNGYIENDTMWIVFSLSSIIIEMNLKNGKHKTHIIGEETIGYSCIIADGGYLWLTESESGNVVKWEAVTKSVRKYKAPINVKKWGNVNKKRFVHRKLLNTSKWIVTVPDSSNFMMIINKKTDKIELLESSFFINSDIPNSIYDPSYYAACSFAKIFADNLIWVQRSLDRTIAEIDLDSRQVRLFTLKLTDYEYSKIYKKEEGFDYGLENGIFAKRETEHFPLEQFIIDIQKTKFGESMEVQKVVASEVAENLDGTAGEKIHKYFTGKIFEE